MPSTTLQSYETLFVLTPVLSKDQLEDSMKKFRGVLDEQKAEIVHSERMGLKKLAYPIQNKSTGFYCLIEFRAAPSTVKTLETAYRRDEQVIRFATFCLDKHGVDYNAKKRADTSHISQPTTEKNA